jgi:hypothetical protein
LPSGDSCGSATVRSWQKSSGVKPG